MKILRLRVHAFNISIIIMTLDCSMKREKPKPWKKKSPRAKERTNKLSANIASNPESVDGERFRCSTISALKNPKLISNRSYLFFNFQGRSCCILPSQASWYTLDSPPWRSGRGQCFDGSYVESAFAFPASV